MQKEEHTDKSVIIQVSGLETVTSELHNFNLLYFSTPHEHRLLM
jgi:hypothetical protein